MHKVELHPRILSEKARDPLHGKKVEKVSHRCNSNQSIGLLTTVHQFLTCIDQPVDRDNTALIKRLPRIRKRELAR